MRKLAIKLTQPQIDALLVAAYAMMAGEEGDGDFQCSAGVLQRAIDALEQPPIKTKLPRQRDATGGASERGVKWK